jgi:hypothetical protein
MNHNTTHLLVDLVTPSNGLGIEGIKETSVPPPVIQTRDVVVGGLGSRGGGNGSHGGKGGRSGDAEATGGLEGVKGVGGGRERGKCGNEGERGGKVTLEEAQDALLGCHKGGPSSPDVDSS